MRCNYRCNMWCKCKKPARPYPPTPTIYDISSPSTDSVDVVVGMGSIVAFEYSPTEGTPNVTLTIADPSVAHVSEITYTDGLASFTITGDNVGETTVAVVNTDNREQTYEITVEVTEEPTFDPENNILVDKEEPPRMRGEARGFGEMYIAKAFAADVQSTDYVQLSWTYGNTPTVEFVGLADNDYCHELFTEEVSQSIATSIETFDDEGLVKDGSVKFSDTAWVALETYFNSPLTPSSIETTTEVVESNPTRFVSVKFNTELSDTVGYVGGTIDLYLTKPDRGGSMSDVPNTLDVYSIDHVSGDGYNMIIHLNVIGVGVTTVTYTGNDGNSDTIIVECMQPYIPAYDVVIATLDLGTGTINGEAFLTSSYADGTYREINNNTLTIGEDDYVAIPEEGYEFSEWGTPNSESSGEISANCNFYARFEEIPYVPTTEYISIYTEGDLNGEHISDIGGTVNGETDISNIEYEIGTAWSVNSNVLTIGQDEYTAAPGEGWEFGGWVTPDGNSSGTITEDTSFTAVFNSTWDVVRETIHGGIYHSIAGGLFYLVDDTGENKIVISDKNLNASGLWDPSDPTDSGEYGTWGGYHQWGNNNNFSDGEYTTTTEQIDASGYGPSNPYSSNVFVNYDCCHWDSSNNTNLWGNDDWASDGDVTLMRGPCPEGRHVPDWNEVETLFLLRSYIMTGDSSNYYQSTQISTDLLLPIENNYDYFFTSTLYDYDGTYCPVVGVYGTQMMLYAMNSQGFNDTIRPFKDELPAVLPEWSEMCLATVDSGLPSTASAVIGTPTHIPFTTTYDCDRPDFSGIQVSTLSGYSGMVSASVYATAEEQYVIVNGITEGRPSITLTDTNGHSSRCRVTITTPAAVIQSGSENITIEARTSVTKTISYSPADSSAYNITITSSNSNIATGQKTSAASGEMQILINALRSGSCTITVSDGTNSYVYNVTATGTDTITLSATQGSGGTWYDDGGNTLTEVEVPRGAVCTLIGDCLCDGIEVYYRYGNWELATYTSCDPHNEHLTGIGIAMGQTTGDLVNLRSLEITGDATLTTGVTSGGTYNKTITFTRNGNDGGRTDMYGDAVSTITANCGLEMEIRFSEDGGALVIIPEMGTYGFQPSDPDNYVITGVNYRGEPVDSGWTGCTPEADATIEVVVEEIPSNE